MKTLLQHQIDDARFLAERSFAGNFSGMGSGKTLTALEAVRLVNPALTIIVCPPIAMNMWSREAKEHLGIDAQIILTGKTQINLQGKSVLIISYAIATKRSDELRDRCPGVLILDESHACKSTSAKRTVAILGSHGIAGTAAHTWCLTGTPMTRWNDDMFSFLCRAAPDKLKAHIGKLNEQRFRLRYCITQKKKFSAHQRFPVEVVVGNRNTTELNDMLFGTDGSVPCAVRRELAEVWAAMPPMTENRLTIKLDTSPELKAMLKIVEKKTMAQIAEDIRSDAPAMATLRLELGVAKVKDSVAVLVDRLEAGHGPILVGAWHTAVIDALAVSLTDKGYRTGIIDGRTSADKRQWLQDAFNAKELDVLVGQISAMGVAIDLQHGGNRIVVVEEDWSPSVMAQFYARLMRMGQQNHVHIEVLASDTKLEEAVARISRTKAREADKLMDQSSLKSTPEQETS
jgi:SNF2 family DNA or RNA helicase